MHNFTSESLAPLLQRALETGEPLFGSLDADGRWSDIIQGEDVADALRKAGDSAHPKGLNLYGFIVCGQLDLSSTKIGLELTMRSCVFEREIRAPKAELASLDLVGSTFPGMNLDGAVIRGSLDISLATSTATISAAQAQVTGNVFGHQLRVASTRNFSLLFNGTKFGSDVILSESTFAGGIRFRGCQVAASIDLRASYIRANGSVALDLDHASLKHLLDVTGLRARGMISLRRLHLDGDIEGDDLEILAAEDSAFDATSAVITGSVSLKMVEFSGTASLDRITLSGNFIMRNCTVRSNSSQSPGLSLFNSSIRGEVYLSDCEIMGGISSPGAVLGSNLVVIDSTLLAVAGHALYLNRAQISGHTKVLSCSVVGTVACQGVKFGGEINFTGTNIAGARSGVSLDLFSSSCAYSVVLDRATIDGGLELGECTVGTFVSMHDCQISAWHTNGVTARNLKVTTKMSVRDAVIDGTIDMSNIAVAGELSFKRVELTASDPRVVLDGSNLGTFVLADTGDLFHGISLNKARIDTLRIEASSSKHLPQLLGARDMHVGALDGKLSDNKRELQGWLLTLRKLAPAGTSQKHKVRQSQPWHEVARALQSMGRSGESRWFHIKAAEQVTSASSVPGRIVRLAYGALAGYGYRPWYVLGWLGVLWCVALALALAFGESFYPTDPALSLIVQERVAQGGSDFEDIQRLAASAGYTPLNQYLFALEAVIPTPQVGQIAAWRPNPASPLSFALSLLRGASWLLSALLLASVTGLLRKI